ncbi:hypothetical protein TBLA_0D04690 [Henningerozyma blattae CBS 6284]|uniref:Uncharacterized protein n=1 Tax=Henningerozyma blattae (strain ATCC 34711 / CBS 6284 / DSM 70876 / NBRC 10599 / NRRL Y-10934 / UCD 77-7) TaxID=1071380 RepID=I2H3L3_HENB6|nr:hypothetical protein TBLA_0D04690 [Tetrapisispora blattae CBS 6284]CCH60965.1 hypothetical protein TBLA_0D04690 [Tetrapisispora blattae CBS 6284]
MFLNNNMFFRNFLFFSLYQLALGHVQHEHELTINSSSLQIAIQYLQHYVFPFDARYNAIVATLLIQFLPCLFIFLIPGLKNNMGNGSVTSSLLMAFALGTLFGDVFLHLVPEIYVGIDAHDHFKLHVLSGTIFLGFGIFMFLDKFFRIISMSPDGTPVSLHSHSHAPITQFNSHSHSHSNSRSISTDGKSSPKKKKNKNKNKKKSGNNNTDSTDELNDLEKIFESSTNASTSHEYQSHSHGSSSSAYLSIITGFIHSLTDGIALASAFYISKAVGVTTTIAIIFHEIPHEISDFAILLSSGFTFYQAVKSQLVTSIGAVIGTLIGCWLNEDSSMDSTKSILKYARTLVPENVALYLKQLDLCSYIHQNVRVLQSYIPQNIRNLQSCIPSVKLDCFYSHLEKFKNCGINLSELMLPLTAGGFIYVATINIVPEILRTSGSCKCKEAFVFILQTLAIISGFLLILNMPH